MHVNSKLFTHSPIPGVKPSKMLPDGFALVLEGGGTRGFYTAGVFEAFSDAGIMFPYIIGVSAGAANVLSYISGQAGRNRTIVEAYVADPRYLSIRNLLRHRSLFGYDFIFRTIPEKHLFWDRAAFDGNDIRLLTGAIDCRTGETVWFEKGDICDGFDVVRASCSIPFLSRPVSYGGYKLLDGGTASPIPIEKSIADGNRFHVVVLTRNQGYQKEPLGHEKAVRAYYRRYPKLAEVLLDRHERYNRQLALCEQLEKENKALIIRPQKPLHLDRLGHDTEKLLTLYDEGHAEGAEVLQLLKTLADAPA